MAAVLALQLALLVFVGDVTLRLAGWESLWRRLPEFCFLIGLPTFGFCGYLLLAATTSALSILPGVITLALVAVWIVHRRPRGESLPLPDAVRAYETHRATCRMSWAVLLVLPVLILGARWNWLAHPVLNGQYPVGTLIADDARTIGFPLSLAAFGYPLHSPLSADSTLAYPLGPFQFAAGVMAAWPHLVLPAAVADTTVTALYYATVMVMAAAWLAGSDRLLNLLFSATCTVSVSLELNNVSAVTGQPWYKFWFGYAALGSSTVGGDVFQGLLWEPNHMLAFSIYVAATLLSAGARGKEAARLALVLVLCCFGAMASLDLTIWAIIGAAMWAAWTAWRERRIPWHIVLPMGVAILTFTLIAFPSLTGKMDGFKPRLPSLEHKQWLFAAMVSTHGILILVALLAAPLVTSWQRIKLLLVAASVPTAFLLAFHYGSFWFWRSTKILIPLLAVICTAMLTDLGTRKARLPLACLWVTGLLLGSMNTKQEFDWCWHSAPLVSSPVAEGIEWVYSHTRLDARVAGWRVREGSLVPSTDYLRTGNRSGRVVFDRSQVVVGFKRTTELLSDLVRGIAFNDYVLYFRDDPEFEAILTACRAPAAFQNPGIVIYEVAGTCRAGLSSVEVAQAYRAFMAASWRNLMAETDPTKLSDLDYIHYVKFRPDQAGLLARRRAEALWAASRYPDASRFLEQLAEVAPDNGEIYYSWAFSLQAGGKPRDALPKYDKALALGYAEFWVRYNRGCTLASLGETGRARLDLQRAVELDPAHAGAKTQLDALGK